jgi:hypothetical protein
MWKKHWGQPQTLRAVLATLSFLGVFGFITGNLGHLSPPLNGLIALLLLIFFASCHFSGRALNIREAAKKPLILGMASFLVASATWVIGGEMGRCLAVIFFLFSVDWINKALGHTQPKLSVYQWAATFISLYVILYKHVPPMWFAVQEGSQVFSHGLSLLARDEMRFGATASGFHLLMFFFLYVFSSFWPAQQRSWRSLAVMALLGVLAHTLYLIIHAPVFIPLLKLFQNPYHLGHTHYRLYAITSLNTTIFFLGLLAIPLFLVERAWRVEERQKTNHRWAGVAVSAGLVLLGMFGLSSFPGKEEIRGKILLYDKGYLNWDRPVFGKYGERSTGMFGLLPEFLQAAGFQVKKSPVISDAVLGDCSTLVVINLQQPFARDEHEAIWRFVKNGGSLLALGDHTGLAGIREPFNDLLKPVGIEIEFDSAHYLTDWDHSFEVFPHPVTWGVPANRELGISIGASLQIPASVAPVVVAKYGFSDMGNANASRHAYLGDRKYNSGERLSDIVLVGSARYGQGKVLVFGDTSSFQNGTLVVAHRFVRRVFHWLTDSSSTSRPYLMPLSLLLLLGGFGFLLMREGWTFGTISCLASALLLGVAGAGLINSLRQTDKPFQGKMAYVDTSHVERLDLTYSQDESFLGLSYNLMRNGFLPIEMNQFSEEQLRAGKLFVAIAPTKPFSASELDALKQFMAEGGTFLLCAGWEEVEGSQNVLQAFGVGLENIPLGPIDAQSNTAGVQFYNAWPIRLEGGRNAQVISSFKDASFPLIVQQAHGSGRFVFIGDPDLRLEKGGVITGKVTEESGEPVVLARAEVIGLERQSGLSRDFKRLGPFFTDDRGVYRIFGLPAGRYVVSVTQIQSIDQKQEHIMAYYPGVRSQSQASPVEVTPGSEITGIDFTIERRHSSGGALAGRISRWDGSQVSRAFLWAYANGPSATRAGVVLREDGSYELKDLPLGNYTLEVLTQESALVERTRVNVYVGASGTTELNITIEPSAEVSGRFELENGQSPKPVTGLSVLALIEEKGYQRPGRVEPNGGFRISRLPSGPIRLWALTGASRYYVLRILHEENELPEARLSLEPGARVRGMRVILSDQGAVLRGTVQQATQDKPAAGAWVILTPVGETQQEVERLRRFGRVDQRGQFIMEGIAPGLYFVLATRNPRSIPANPSLLESLALNNPKAVTLLELKARAQQDLRLRIIE